MSALAFALTGASLPGFADNGPSPSDTTTTSTSGDAIAEVMVTATRREEREQDVPISIASLGEEQLNINGLTSMDDITRVTPGVTFQRNGTAVTGNYDDQDSDINIRGVQSTAGASTTGVYIDDVPIQSRRIGFATQNAYPVVFDLDRVEILRGPQGTLFGASSEGGTVRFIQPQPSLTNSTLYTKTEVSTTYNGDPSYIGGLAAGAPLIDGVLGIRFSGYTEHDGGWVNRVDPYTLQVVDRDSNSRNSASAHLALIWQPKEGLTITPSYYFQQIQTNDTAAFWGSLSNPNDGVWNNGNRGSVYAFDPFYILELHVDWHLPYAELISNTAYYSRNQHTTSDATQSVNEVYFGSSYPPYGVYSPVYVTDQQHNYYQEVRLQSATDTARLTWTLGAYYTHSTENSASFIVAPTLNERSGGTVCATIPCPGGVIYNLPFDWVLDKDVALFGEGVYKITDKLKLTAGVRVSWDTIEGASYVSGPLLGQAPITSSGSTSETPVTPRAVLAYQPDRNDMFYGSASKGFRPGGVNAGVGVACAGGLEALGLTEAPPSYKSDSLWSYEIGSKNTLWDQRLQINSSLFYIDWKNIQQSVYLGSCGLTYVANLGAVTSKGGDVSITVRATDALTLNLVVAYTDAKYTSTECATATIICAGPNAVAAPVVTDGDTLPVTPWTVSAIVDYLFPKIFDRTPYFHVLYTYASAQNGLTPYQDGNNAVSDPTLAGIPESKDLSLRAGLRWAGSDLSLFANNVTNQQPILFDSRDFASPAVQLYFHRSVQPRTVGLTWTYHY